ncbi:uncharacterized protein LOC100486894 isoform X2 [Xenopus tropicalis]|uniref:Uncharacterized protein LOC100486894 isoform X2 n=1 Tax=Xenopus tropicalis TaxID=8364 RepID=A0A8J1IU22_XENTR|nr:uncharacterized protein LOC100486894 isoform X2 [Xenopus tropicalis]|eukprot:XP_012824613.1 PREDICTED: uncharacterized protein LOC100486894 isoform X2 [Xenopus tropicalis]
MSSAPSSESTLKDIHQDLHVEAVGTSEDFCTIAERILNGCESPLLADITERAKACDHLKVEENLEPEDLLNNNKELFEQELFANQNSSAAVLGISSVTQILHSFTDDPKLEGNELNNQDAFHVAHHSFVTCLDQDKENVSVYNKTTKADVLGNTETLRSEDEQSCGMLCEKSKTIDSEQNVLCGNDLLRLQGISGDQEETRRLEAYSGERHNDNATLKGENSLFNNILTDLEKSTEMGSETIGPTCAFISNMPLQSSEDSVMMFSSDAQGHSFKMSLGVEDRVKNHCNNLHSTGHEPDKHMSEGKEIRKVSQNNQSESGTYSSPENESEGHSQKDVSEILDIIINRSTYQVKHASRGASISVSSKHVQKQTDVRGEKYKARAEMWPLDELPVRRSIAIDDIPEESDLSSDKEIDAYDGDEEENLEREDHNEFLPYSSSQDRIDPRKERHRYVSDSLDPDVLQLLEKHLQKQQLVDIKEEGEEELVDVHINIERPRTESFKGLRNIPPVLDIVLEEPELENTGDSFEEGSKTPSEIDSDDSSNIYAMEMGLIESLQHDLMSKTDKIDKQEIATIFQRTSTDPFVQEKDQVKGDIKHHIEHSDDQVRNMSNVPTSGGGTLVLDADLKCDLDKCTQQSNTDHLILSEEQTILHTKEGQFILLEPIISEKSLQPCPPLCNHKTDTDASIEQIDSNLCRSPGSVAIELMQPKAEQYSKDSDGTAQPGSDNLKTEQTEDCFINNILCPVNEGAKLPSEASHLELLADESDLVQASEEQFLVEDSSSIAESHSIDHCDGVEETLVSTETRLTDPPTINKASSSPAPETHLSDQPFLSASEMSTLHMDLKEKMLALLEKAHAVDCRSSHLQEAELLWKQSEELRNECKSLSKEAEELLSMISQQGALHRQPIGEDPYRTTRGSRDSLNASEIHHRKAKTLTNKANKLDSQPKVLAKENEQLRVLSKKYDFLRKEAPEVMKELSSLQHQLKCHPEVKSKPMRFLHNLLWGGLITGGAMLLAWWSTKQLG